MKISSVRKQSFLGTDQYSEKGNYELYEAKKKAWESQNLEATFTEHEIAIKRIARESGV
jgi:hypothetical protein